MGESSTQEQGRRLSFTGEFRHTIDEKGRLIVPSRHRFELEEDKVVLTVWFDKAIALWSGEHWRNLEQRLLEQSRSNPGSRAFVRSVASSAHQDVVDKQGRIQVPQELRDWAGITRECVVVGDLDHAEIWNPDQWDRQKAQVSLDDLAEQLSF